MSKSTHECPKDGCKIQVPNRLFCCLPHWHQLPGDVKGKIHATSTLHVLEPRRRMAIRSAREAWGDIPSLAALEAERAIRDLQHE